MIDPNTKPKVEVQVLPYMGKPEPDKYEKARKAWKPPTVITTGNYTKPPKIKQDWQE